MNETTKRDIAAEMDAIRNERIQIHSAITAKLAQMLESQPSPAPELPALVQAYIMLGNELLLR